MSHPTDPSASVTQVTTTPARASRTYVSDHVWMMDIPDNALRLWLALRSLVFEKNAHADGSRVRITDDELARLTHRSVSSARRARVRAAQAGLLAEHGRTTESYSGADGRHLVRTVRHLRVLHVDPPEGYDGPTNVYTELRRIRGVSAGQPESSNLNTQVDQGERGETPSAPEPEQPSDQERQDVSAGHSESSNLPNSPSNLPNSPSNLHTATPSDQAKGNPQVLPASASPTDQAASVSGVTPGAGSGGLVGGGGEEHAEAADLLASLPVRVPLPASAVRTLAPHVADLLASGWTPGELTECLTTGLPASYGAGLIIRRVQDARPRVRPSTGDLEARIEARISEMASRPDDSGARLADQVLGTTDWRPPERGEHSAATYIREIVPGAASQFIADRRDQLAEVMRTVPAWRP